MLNSWVRAPICRRKWQSYAASSSSNSFLLLRIADHRVVDLWEGQSVVIMEEKWYHSWAGFRLDQDKSWIHCRRQGGLLNLQTSIMEDLPEPVRPYTKNANTVVAIHTVLNKLRNTSASMDSGLQTWAQPLWKWPRLKSILQQDEFQLSTYHRIDIGWIESNKLFSMKVILPKSILTSKLKL